MDNPLAQDLDHILTHVQWDELRGQRLFVTGGTGFLGCWMTESFIWANGKLGLNAKAVILTRHPEEFIKKAPHIAKHPSISLYQGDVRDFKFPEGEFSHILHMATDESHRLTTDNPTLMLLTIKDGVGHTLNFAQQCGVQKFLLFSSGAVYGEQPENIKYIPEDYESGYNGLNPYVRGKRVAEQLCAIYSGKLETKIARGFSFVGAYLPLDIHYAIGNFIRDALIGSCVFVKGDGRPIRSYLYAADATIWFWNILFKGKSRYPYNVGSGRALTIAEVAKIVSKTTYPPMAVKFENILSDSHKRYVPSIKRANELGLKEYISLEDAIFKTISWYRGEYGIS